MERLRQKRKRVISILSLFFIGSLFTFYFLFKIDFKVINFVNPKNPSVHVGQIIGEHFFGTKSMEIVISYKKASDKWLYQEQKAIEEIENKIEKVFHPLHLTSSNTLVKRLNSIQINGNPKAYRLLKNLDEKDIEPYLNALGGGAIVSRDGTKSKIKFGFVEDSLEASLAKYKELEMYLKSKSGGQVEYQISGSSVLADRSIYRTTIHIISGLFLALLISAFLILIYYKSIRLAYGALLVNAIPVISCLIFLTILHVQINPQSLFLVSVLAGLCMDDSIYLMGYKSKSLRSIVLFPISATSLVLALAFSSLLFSSYIWLREFSVVFLVGISMAFLLDLFIFPVFMNFISSKND